MKSKSLLPGHVLLVDDEKHIRDGLQLILHKDGHKVCTASTGETALNLLPGFPAEVAVLDIRMPGMRGTDLLTALKSRRPYLAVIMLTGHGTVESAAAAVRSGAFDYLLKPAHPAQLRRVVGQALATARRQREEMALLEAMQHHVQRLRSLPPSPAAGEPAERRSSLVRRGDLVIDRDAHEVYLGDRRVALTPSEYRVLLLLAERAGGAVAYGKLVREALDYDVEPWEAKELVKRHIYTLRRKLERHPARPQRIRNVRGVGYRLAANSP